MKVLGVSFRNESALLQKWLGLNYAQLRESSSIIPRHLNTFAISSEQKNVLPGSIN